MWALNSFTVELARDQCTGAGAADRDQAGTDSGHGRAEAADELPVQIQNMCKCYSPTSDGDALAEARKSQQTRPAAGGKRCSDWITQGLTRILRSGGPPDQQRVTHSVGSDIQKGAGRSIPVLLRGLPPRCRRTGRWREDIARSPPGGTCTPGRVWPAERCNRNRAGQVTVGAGTVIVRHALAGLLACNSAGSGGAGLSGAGEEDSIEIKRGSVGRVGRPGLRKR